MNPDQLRRTSTPERLRSGSNSSGSRLGTPEAKRYDPKKNGYGTLFLIARKLHGRRDNGNIPWNEIRNIYRKETGRHLNSEELNVICGTEKKTKHELLHEKFSNIFDLVDEKAQLIRLRSLSSPVPVAMNLDQPGPSRSISPLTFEAGNGRRLSAEEKRKAITENLLRSGLLMSDGSASNRNKSIFSHSSVSTCDQIANDSCLSIEEDVFDDLPPVIEEPKEDGSAQELSTGQAEAEDAAFDSWAAHTRTFSQEDNSEEIMEKFERSLLERQNSLGSIDGDEEPDYPVVLQLSADEDDSDTAKAQVSSVSSTMNAAFIASESQYISFDSVAGGTETSGEQGYTTGNEQLSSPLSDLDISLNFNSSPLNGREPDTPRMTHEITMCSSRNENDEPAAMPQPDVSPLTEDDSEDNDIYKVRYRPVDFIQANNGDSIEDRVPHLSLPRGSHVKDFAKGDFGSNDASGQAVTSRSDPAVADSVLGTSMDDSSLGTTSTATTVLHNDPPQLLFSKPSGDHAETDDDNISYDDESQKSDDEHHHHRQESKTVVLPTSENAVVSTATVEMEINDDSQNESVSGTIATEDNTVVVKMVGDFLRKPSDNLERQTSSLSTIPEDRETIASVSPMKELDHPKVTDVPVEAEAAPEAPKQKKGKRVRIRMPRRRWFDCCTIL